MAEERHYLFKNFARSTLGAALSASATSLQVEAGHGDRFPSPGPSDIYEPDQIFSVILKSGSAYEVAYCTARGGDVLTVERGKEGTTAQAFPLGASVIHQVTAGFFEQQAVPSPPSFDPVAFDVTVQDAGDLFIGYNSALVYGSIDPDPPTLEGETLEIVSREQGNFVIRFVGGADMPAAITTITVETSSGDVVLDAQAPTSMGSGNRYRWDTTMWAAGDNGVVRTVTFG